MATIVYTSIDSLQEIESANWKEGDQESYASTQRMAEACATGIMLIGRQAIDCSVQIHYARTRYTDWRCINGWHVALAKFFFLKLNDAPAGSRLSPFFDSIDDEITKNAARQLIYLECGTNADGEDIKRAVNTVSAHLKALGVPCGDWSFLPMIEAAR